MNSIIVLNPYRKNNTWVFDDAAVGLKAEPFVYGIPEMIDAALAKRKIKNADSGFILLVAPNGLPSPDLYLTWTGKEHGGNWYNSEELKMEGWLCPALYKYFPYAPAEIYARVEEIKERVVSVPVPVSAAELSAGVKELVEQELRLTEPPHA